MKRSLLVLAVLDLVLAVTLIYLVATLVCNDSLTECIGYCDVYWGDNAIIIIEEYYDTCVDTCEMKEIR